MEMSLGEKSVLTISGYGSTLALLSSTAPTVANGPSRDYAYGDG